MPKPSVIPSPEPAPQSPIDLRAPQHPTSEVDVLSSHTDDFHRPRGLDELYKKGFPLS